MNATPAWSFLVEHIPGIHDTGHGCNDNRGPDHVIVDNKAEALECIHHKFISVESRMRNVFGSDMTEFMRNLSLFS